MISHYHRGLITGTIAVAIVAGLFYRNSTSVQGMGTLEVSQSQSLFAPLQGGTVVEVLASVGDTVEKGQMIARLDNPELEYAVIQAEMKAEQLRAKIHGLHKRALSEPQLLDQRSTLQAALDAAERQLELAVQQYAELELRAPCSGVVLPPNHELAQWPHGGLVGTVFPGSAIWCYVGDPSGCRAQVTIDRNQRRHVGTGSEVRLVSATQGSQLLRGQVVAILEPTESSVQPEDAKNSKQREVVVWCSLPKNAEYQPGTEVRAWIDGPEESVLLRWSRNLYQTFAP